MLGIVELFDGSSEAMCVNLLEKFILKCEHLDLLKAYMFSTLKVKPHLGEIPEKSYV